MEIDNLRDGQPHGEEIIGRTREQLIKVEGVVQINGQDIDVTVRRAPNNSTLAGASLLYDNNEQGCCIN